MLNIAEIAGEREKQFDTICCDGVMNVVSVSLVVNCDVVELFETTETFAFVRVFLGLTFRRG